MSLPKPSPLGRKLLRAAMKAMRANPESVAMLGWISGNPTGGKPIYDCGTVGCIAGHVVLQAGKKTASVHSRNFFPKKLQETLNLKVKVSDSDDGGTSIGTNAARLISGNPKAHYSDFRNLFFFHMWPSPFELQFEGVSAPSKQQTDVVIRRIQHYLKTGE